MKSARRVMYVEYAGDVINSFRHWREGRRDPTEVADTYSGQFLDAFAESVVLLTVPNPHRGACENGRVRVEHLYPPFQRRSGILWHLGQLLTLLAVVYKALAFRAADLFISSSPYIFLTAPLRFRGTRIVVIYRTCPVDPRASTHGFHALLHRVTLCFLQRSAHRIIALAPRAARMLRAELPGRADRVVGYLPSFDAQDFLLHARPALRPPFRLLMVGRIEREKGVYDFVDMVRDLRERLHLPCVADICGDGKEAPNLERYIADRDLDAFVFLRGRCSAEQMKGYYAAAHVCLVPTRSSCGEGFNKVIAEAVLHRIPVVSSAVCPATELVNDAVLLAEADDVESYVQAIHDILTTPGRYERLIQEAEKYRDALLNHKMRFRDALAACAAES